MAGPSSASTGQCHASANVVRLTGADDGHRIRVCEGARIEVTLRAPLYDTPDTWWQPVTVTGSALHVVPSGIRSAARGVMLATFDAGRPGTATLRSARIACPVNPSGPPCHPFRRWRATIKVS
jgi:hypothetical protein